MLFAGFLLYSIFLIPVLRALEGFKKGIQKLRSIFLRNN